MFCAGHSDGHQDACLGKIFYNKVTNNLNNLLYHLAGAECCNILIINCLHYGDLMNNIYFC